MNSRFDGMLLRKTADMEMVYVNLTEKEKA